MPRTGEANRLRKRADRSMLYGVLAGCAILSASLGLLYTWYNAREAQLQAVRTELLQLARVAATEVNGEAHRGITSAALTGGDAHLALLAPLVKFHKATSDIIYVYTAIIRDDQIYFVLGTDYYLYRVAGDELPPDPIMKPYHTADPALRRAPLQREPAAALQLQLDTRTIDRFNEAAAITLRRLDPTITCTSACLLLQ